MSLCTAARHGPAAKVIEARCGGGAGAHFRSHGARRNLAPILLSCDQPILLTANLAHNGGARAPPNRSHTMPLVAIEAEPQALVVELERTALIIIDMQRDFLEPGGFGEALGNDVSLLRTRDRALPRRARRRRAGAGMLVIHTREGHRPDLSDVPPAKLERGAPRAAHRRRRPDGPHPGARRARPRHHSPRSTPRAGEPVIDKPGKGAFYATDLELDPAATAASST